MSKLRPLQADLVSGIYGAWGAGARIVMPVLPTGGGKTVVIGAIHREYDRPSIAVAHRQELVGQISTALAREGVVHDLLTRDNKSALRRKLNDLHMSKFGRTFLSDRAIVHVGGVDTVKNMHDDPRLKQKALCTIDEGHHVLKHNKWGKLFGYLPPTCYGLLPTATPRRADGMGLGAHADGLVDVMVEGPQMRKMINMGYLTDYEVACPKVSDLDLQGVEISATTGDYNQDQLRKAIRKSTKIVGDVVQNYLKLAKGKQTIVFAVDVDECFKIEKEFRTAGVKAAAVHGEMHDGMRGELLRQFEARELQVLINVDLFGEGFDVPGIEVVMMARPTASFSLYCQQWGRCLRLVLTDYLTSIWDTFSDAGRRQLIAESPKPFGLIIDMVGNIIAHQYPDKLQIWSLDRREKRIKGAPLDAIPLRRCLNPVCLKPYERSETKCPHCHTVPPLPKERSGPEFVDGDLDLLDMETLAKLRGDVEHIDAPAVLPWGQPAHIQGGVIARHNFAQDQQRQLRETIGQWAGYNSGYTERVLHKRFYLTFGLTVLEAKALNAKDAQALKAKIETKFTWDIAA